MIRLSTTDHNRDSAGMRYVYPVLSRRAGGVSVGINLNPNNACNWRCIYCQVPDLKRGAAPAIDLALLESELRGFLQSLARGEAALVGAGEGELHVVDVALSGNGEPTSATEFPDVIELVGAIMDSFGLAGKVQLRVITNGSLVGRTLVQEGLRRLGERHGEAWFKVDAGTTQRMRLINGVELTPQAVATNLRRCAALCRTWVQSCFFALDGEVPSADEIDAYVALLETSEPARLAGVHLYGLARASMQPEAPRLARLDALTLEGVAERVRELGLTVTVNP